MVDLLVWEFGMRGRVGALEVGGHKGVKVWVRTPARGCPGPGSHRPGVPEGHAHQAVGQWQVRSWSPGQLGVERSTRTQRRAHSARRLHGLLWDPRLQTDSEEEAAGASGTAGRPGGPWTWSRPERVNLKLENACRQCLER